MERRRFLLVRARGLDRYASGTRPTQYDPQSADKARAAIQRWERAIADGQDQKSVAEAKDRRSDLKKIVDDN